MLDKIDSSYFTWDIWRGGSVKELGLHSRSLSVTSPEGKRLLRKHAIGYCDAETLNCRPKFNQYAIMCWNPITYDNFWFHMFKEDFIKIFLDKY